MTGPMAVVSLVTVVVLAADVLLGSHLQLSSLLGLQPVVGGRFYGVGNVTFAVFASAALLLAVAVSGHYVRQGRPAPRGRRRARHRRWWRSPWTAPPCGERTAAVRPPCCRAWRTSCWPSSASG